MGKSMPVRQTIQKLDSILFAFDAAHHNTVRRWALVSRAFDALNENCFALM